MEEALLSWIWEHPLRHVRLSRKMTRSKVKELTTTVDFKASVWWLLCFKKWKGLSTCVIKLPSLKAHQLTAYQTGEFYNSYAKPPDTTPVPTQCYLCYGRDHLLCRYDFRYYCRIYRCSFSLFKDDWSCQRSPDLYPDSSSRQHKDEALCGVHRKRGMSHHISPVPTKHCCALQHQPMDERLSDC